MFKRIVVTACEFLIGSQIKPCEGSNGIAGREQKLHKQTEEAEKE